MPNSGESMALLNDGTVMDWGLNGSGQLGDGVEGASDVPVPVSSLTGMTAIGAGRYFSLAASNQAVAPAPAIARVKPNHGPVSGGTTVTITGSNLSGAISVKFGVTNAATFVIHNRCITG
jgi:hypothetical protein